MSIAIAGVLAVLAGFLWKTGLDMFDLGNGVFSSLVAVTGDAHQAQVAQDIFRQEVKYERSLRVREDIRDVHKLMVENVQAHLFMGSIILGICFSMFIEGYPPPEAHPVFIQLWVCMTTWSASLTTLSLWLANHFQTIISNSARERLLKGHRAYVVSDTMIGRMGGHNLSGSVANLHSLVQKGLSGLLGMIALKAGPERKSTASRRDSELGSSDPSEFDGDRRQAAGTKGEDKEKEDMPSIPLRVKIEVDTSSDDEYEELEKLAEELTKARQEGSASVAELQSAFDRANTERKDGTTSKRFGRPSPLRQNMRGWLSASGGAGVIVDSPEFLLGETMVPFAWDLPKSYGIQLRVWGDATLYIAAQSPKVERNAKTGEKVGVEEIREAFRIRSRAGSWPHRTQLWIERRSEDEVVAGVPPWEVSREAFRQVEGYTISIADIHDQANYMELPLFKAVLDPAANRSMLHKGRIPEWQELRVRWRFPEGVEGFVLVVRQGRICHTSGKWCHEDDWPVVEFENQAADMTPYRSFSGHYMRAALLCLFFAACLTYLARATCHRPWPQCAYEIVILGLGFFPGVFIVSYMSLDVGLIQWETSRVPMQHMWLRQKNPESSPRIECGRSAPLSARTGRVSRSFSDPFGLTSGSLSSFDVTSSTIEFDSDKSERCSPTPACGTCCFADANASQRTESEESGRSCPAPDCRICNGNLKQEQQEASGVAQGGCCSTKHDATDEEVTEMPLRLEHSEAEIVVPTERSNSIGFRALQASSTDNLEEVYISHANSNDSDGELVRECSSWAPDDICSMQNFKSERYYLCGCLPRKFFFSDKLSDRLARASCYLGLLFIMSLLVVAWSLFTETEQGEHALGRQLSQRLLSDRVSTMQDILIWDYWNVSWPSFFYPSGVAFSVDDQFIFVASDRLLWRLSLRNAADLRRTVSHGFTPPLMLPDKIHGLSVDLQSRDFFVVADGMLHVLELPRRDTVSNTLVSWISAASQAVPSTAAGQSLSLPKEAISVSAVAVMPGLRSSNDVAKRRYFLLGTNEEAGKIYLCYEDSGVLVVNAVLQVPGQGLGVRGLLACGAGKCGGALEVILWGVNTGGQLFAFGMETGSLLGSWQLPGRDGVVTASLKGDDTHLWILLVRGAGEPRVIFAPYPKLSYGEEL